MKIKRILWQSAPLLLTGAIMAATVQAATLDDVFRVAERLNAQARTSQAKVDSLTEQTRQLFSEYKTVLKEIEGLRVYNRQLEKQIANQESEMAALTKSIDDVTLIERQITPLMLRMIDGLDQFVQLDIPFQLDEREKRIDDLNSMMDRADVAVSEKFRQVLRAYQIENEYGRTMESYSDSIEINGSDREVDILQVGRIALVYQTSDGEESGVWDKNQRQWVSLDNSYSTPVRNGIRMARSQLAVDFLTIPVSGPETAQ